MADERKPEDRKTFELLSGEYAQALQALEAIEKQASTIVAFGGSDELRVLVDQFIEMAARTKAMAEDHQEPHFAEWFDELMRKAEALRTEIVQR
jgi:hypothetical protein